MCGIFGYLKFGGEVLCPDWLSLLRHRGPDGHGTYEDERIFLSHTRLSIIDPESGKQPMRSIDGRHVISFNGEIYNYRELRERLLSKGRSFSTNSDTEVLLQMYEEYGDKMLMELDGMFAVALWNNQTKRLFLARDFIGKKPLYYFHRKDFLAFGSEIKTLLPFAGPRAGLNIPGLQDYLSFGYVGRGRTIYSDIRELEPGSFIDIGLAGEIRERSYWRLSGDPEPVSAKEAKEKIPGLLKEAVKKRLVSDVPFGLFLSGGLDSTFLLSQMHESLGEGIPAFNIRFRESGFDESGFAETAARCFRADFKSFVFSEKELLENAERFIVHMDQPYGDPSILPLFLLSREASKNSKMVLSGEGGDEIFMGYSRYRALYFLNRLPFLKLPGRVHSWLSGYLENKNQAKRLLAKSLLALSKPCWGKYYTWIATGESLGSLFRDEFADSQKKAPLSETLWELFDQMDPLRAAHFYDLTNYLPSQLLKKADMAGMHSGLEIRCPLLDKKLVEYLFRVPEEMNLGFFSQKKILRQIIGSSVPQTLLRRGKHGFTVPLNEWFRGPLRREVEGKIDGSALLKVLFKPEGLNRILQLHQSGRENFGKTLWLVYVLSLWADKNGIKSLE